VRVIESLNADDGAEYQLRCLACQNDTRHHVVASLTRRFKDPDLEFIERFQIVQCAGCGSPTFRYEKEDAESEQVDCETGESFLATDQRLFPSRDTRPEIAYSQFLPFAVQSVYREVLRALAADTPILVCIGLRALVESACRDLGGHGKLKDMINGLLSSGRFRPEEAKLLDALRDAGNESAHEARALRNDQLLKALWVVEHVLTTVYLLQHHRNDLPSERA
jgi:hypothetical protein